MKLKSLMLGAAAAAAATTAQAADLPVAPEPVDYVRVCDAYGARFYYIPGTETCLRVGGRVRTQFVVNNVLDNSTSPWRDRDEDGTSWLARGYLYLDARTATEFGTLRAYVAMYGSSTSNGTDGDQNGDFEIDNAYIQWGGLTAGRLTSNFDIFTGQTFIGVVDRDWSDETLNQIAYTAAFGNGFSATIALEDRTARQVGDYGGTRAPDAVAALGISQGWGSAQLSGALHQVYPDVDNNNATSGEDNLGWAIGAGVVVNLPMITPGSNIFFQGFYADGALSYIGAGDSEGNVTVSDYGPGTDDTSTGYSLSAGIYVQATTTIGLALDGSYMNVDQPGNSTTYRDFDRWAVDGSVQWEPVSGFILGADAGYANVSPDGASDTDELLFGVRLQRTF